MQPHYDFRNGFSGEPVTDKRPLMEPQEKRPFSEQTLIIPC